LNESFAIEAKNFMFACKWKKRACSALFNKIFSVRFSDQLQLA
jgi:hypothetical protein